MNETPIINFVYNLISHLSEEECLPLNIWCSIEDDCWCESIDISPHSEVECLPSDLWCSVEDDWWCESIDISPLSEVNAFLRTSCAP